MSAKEQKPKPITSPLKAIRAYCLDCVGGVAAEVRKCTGRLCNENWTCPLHPYRFGKGRKSGVQSTLSSLKAIAKNCLWCCGGSTTERELCCSQVCCLKPFREGKNPYLSEKDRESRQRNAARARDKELQPQLP